MAQVVTDNSFIYEVDFFHSGDPRDGFTVMSTDPVTHYEFETPIGYLETHTIVRDHGAIIVRFNWFGFGTQALGTMTWTGPPSREAHMSELVLPHQSMPNSRAYVCEGPDGKVRRFWWHRVEHGNYDLYADDEPAVRIGLFRQHSPPQQHLVGDSYATFFFNFLYEPLLLNALLALSLNRWIDGQDGTVEH